LISVLFFGLRVVVSPATVHVGFTSDAAMMMWYLVWWPYAIWQRINPFFTHAVWPIGGYNLTWATSIPAVAIAFAPITALFGPVVSYNAAALAAPALSGWAAFALCRRITHNFVASIAGGFVYGFSPYEVVHSDAGHLPLTFNFVAPLCALLVLQLLDSQPTRISTRRFSIALALLLALQCLISTEVLATMTAFGAAAFLGAFVLVPGKRRELAKAVAPIGVAYAGAAIILGPFLYYAFVAGAPPKEPVFPSAFFSADLLSFIIPGPLMLIPPHSSRTIVARAATVWEEGCYLGLPLLVIAGGYLWSHRREPVARLLAAMCLLAVVAALGPALHVNGRATVRLPWALTDRLPLIRHALPVRCARYAVLVLAIVLSLWLSQERTGFKKLAVAGLVLAFLPNPLLALHKSSYDTPPFFAQGLYRCYNRRNENVLIIPYGRNGASMAWQAQSWMYFRMPGGHLSTTPEAFRRWPVVNTLETSLPVPDPAAQLRAFAAAYQIDAIVVSDSVQGIARELPALMGLKPYHVGGVSLYRIPARLLRDPPGLPKLEKAASEAWVAELLCAAQRYSAHGGNFADLNPVRAHELGLLPDSKWSDNLELLIAAAPHGASNGLWLGPAPDGALAIGLFATPGAAASLAFSYRPYATRMQYPYPHHYRDRSDDSPHFLMINLRRSVLQGRACQ
jgi:hypothetical protein